MIVRIVTLRQEGHHGLVSRAVDRRAAADRRRGSAVSHPNPRVRDKMLVLRLLHHGLTRQKAAEIVGIGRATVHRYVVAFREGGLDGLRRGIPIARSVRWRPIAT